MNSFVEADRVCKINFWTNWARNFLLRGFWTSLNLLQSFTSSISWTDGMARSSSNYMFYKIIRTDGRIKGRTDRQMDENHPLNFTSIWYIVLVYPWVINFMDWKTWLLTSVDDGVGDLNYQLALYRILGMLPCYHTFLARLFPSFCFSPSGALLRLI